MKEQPLWAGLDPDAQNALASRDYRVGSFAEELATRGVDAGKLVSADRKNIEITDAWIPGVEIFARTIYPQRHRGFFGEVDNYRSDNNVGVVIPPGVAHAIRVEGSEDVIMVYGTSTIFHPEFEGRIASEIETAELPESWRKFLVSET